MTLFILATSYNCSLSIKILCRHSHFHLLPEDWCHALVQIKNKNNNPTLAVCSPLCLSSLAAELQSQLKHRGLARNQGLLTIGSGSDKRDKNRGITAKSKGSFCAFMQPQTAAVTAALAKDSKTSLGTPDSTGLWQQKPLHPCRGTKHYCRCRKGMSLRTYHINSSQSFPKNTWAAILQSQY